MCTLVLLEGPGGQIMLQLKYAGLCLQQLMDYSLCLSLQGKYPNLIGYFPWSLLFLDCFESAPSDLEFWDQPKVAKSYSYRRTTVNF